MNTLAVALFGGILQFIAFVIMLVINKSFQNFRCYKFNERSTQVILSFMSHLIGTPVIYALVVYFLAKLDVYTQFLALLFGTLGPIVIGFFSSIILEATGVAFFYSIGNKKGKCHITYNPFLTAACSFIGLTPFGVYYILKHKKPTAPIKKANDPGPIHIIKGEGAEYSTHDETPKEKQIIIDDYETDKIKNALENAKDELVSIFQNKNFDFSVKIDETLDNKITQYEKTDMHWSEIQKDFNDSIEKKEDIESENVDLYKKITIKDDNNNHALVLLKLTKNPDNKINVEQITNSIQGEGQEIDEIYEDMAMRFSND